METSNIIFPTKHLVAIKIHLNDYVNFKNIWKNNKVLDFYCFGKKVVGENVIFDVRAMRVNEFVQILNDNKINWIKEN